MHFAFVMAINLDCKRRFLGPGHTGDRISAVKRLASTNGVDLNFNYPLLYVSRDKNVFLKAVLIHGRENEGLTYHKGFICYDNSPISQDIVKNLNSQNYLKTLFLGVDIPEEEWKDLEEYLSPEQEKLRKYVGREVKVDYIRTPTKFALEKESVQDNLLSKSITKRNSDPKKENGKEKSNLFSIDPKKIYLGTNAHRHLFSLKDNGLGIMVETIKDTETGEEIYRMAA